MSDRTAASSTDEMPKGFEPDSVEDRWLEAWAEHEIGKADPASSRKPFAMVIPPPNVTGQLHLGHALDQTLQDIVARWKRMAGHDVLWLPGTDHAGIATQNVVEKALREEGIDRRDLGRDRFEERVWEWKEEYGGKILDQIRRMGFTVDWSRLRFTLDEGMSRAVRKVFVELYEQGAIYRGEYMVNWCPQDQTAISDLEVRHREVEGSLYKIAYTLLDEQNGELEEGRLEVETTRPETMLGDTALAVHPDDDRYRALVGRRAVVPLVGREIPVIADDFVDPEFGTGVVKVTPAHDPNDYEAGKRHELELVRVIGFDGRMTSAAGSYEGLDRFEAREKVVADLEAEGRLVGRRAHRHSLGHSDRSGAVVEPMVSTQWFVRMKPLADEALEAASDGRVRFHPDNQHKVFNEWLTNIRDWCISRQLWWGHRIPAWYDDEGTVTVSMEDPDPELGLRQDPDVLDTWFSSALFPFSTLGWPDETPELERYYPGHLLVTGYDILFFWVARMVMMGLRFRGEVPFSDVFLHGLIRDESGVKMSKSRGNGVDPLEVVERHGADALRFTLASQATPGSDFNFSWDRVESSRAFANKLWNATRFALMNLGDADAALQASADAADPKASSLADRWILSRLSALVPALESELESYRVDEACHRLYQFVWHEFCDWYLEMAKPALWAEDASTRETRGTLLATLEVLLRALHPVMPFITEDLWSRLPGSRGLLASSPWAAAQEEWLDEEAERRVRLMQEIVTEFRRLRAEVGIEPGRRVSMLLVAEEADRREDLVTLRSLIAELARADAVEIEPEMPESGQRLSGVVGDVQVLLPLEGVVDVERERERLAESLRKVEEDLRGIEGRLENPGFTGNAPEDVVARARERREELISEAERLRQQIAQLGG